MLIDKLNAPPTASRGRVQFGNRHRKSLSAFTRVCYQYFMKSILIISLAALLMGWGSGCASLTGPHPDDVRRDANFQMMAQRLNELQEQVQALQLENQTLVREMELLRSASRGAGATVQSRVDALEAQVQALQKARVEDRQAIVDDISRKVQGLLATTAGRSAASSSSRASTSDSGYEHVVKSGETLSEIARAYGASTASLRQANRLKGDMIRVGQKLFIPEKR